MVTAKATRKKLPGEFFSLKIVRDSDVLLTEFIPSEPLSVASHK